MIPTSGVSIEVLALVLSGLAFLISLACLIDLLASRRSTHKVQLVDPSSLYSSEMKERNKEPEADLKDASHNPDYRYQDRFWEGVR